MGGEFGKNGYMYMYLFFQKSFYGYDVWKNSEDVFNVSLPYIERHRIDAHKHHKGLPKWLKILLFSLAGTIVALSLFVAGLFVGKGLSKKAAQSHQTVNEAVYSTPQQGQPVTIKILQESNGKKEYRQIIISSSSRSRTYLSCGEPVQ